MLSACETGESKDASAERFQECALESSFEALAALRTRAAPRAVDFPDVSSH